MRSPFRPRESWKERSRSKGCIAGCVWTSDVAIGDWSDWYDAGGQDRVATSDYYAAMSLFKFVVCGITRESSQVAFLANVCCQDQSGLLARFARTARDPASQRPPQKHQHLEVSLSSSIISLLGRTPYHWLAKRTIMFYSESLLSKTGPLARVWLSANLERKLSKTHILQSDIKSSVGAIVDQGQAPMALRLSGQLLLGVVRIYKRQAGYLLDDCNDALVKIKMVTITASSLAILTKN